MSEAPRLCIDCRYANKLTGPPDAWKCGHDSARYQGPASLVTGEPPAPFGLTCEMARHMRSGPPGYRRDDCGPSGKYWEARP